MILLAVLLLMSAMYLPAAPVPDPSAVLDIGPPSKGMTAKEHYEQEIKCMKHPVGYLWLVGNTDEVKKLPSVARLKEKEVGPWLERNIRIKEEDGGRRLRFTIRAGTRAEQVAILNTLLRYYMRGVKRSIKDLQEIRRPMEERAALYAKLAKEERDPDKKADLQRVAAEAKAIRAPERAEIARLEQIAVIKWAK